MLGFSPQNFKRYEETIQLYGRAIYNPYDKAIALNQ